MCVRSRIHAIVTVMTTITAKNSDGYETPAGLAVDPVVMTVKDDNLHVLLIEAEGKHSLPGGFVGPARSPEDAVYAHLEKKTGLTDVYLEQLRTYADPGRDHRGWIPSVAYIGLVDSTKLPDDMGGLWFADTPELLYDHRQIIDDAIERLQGKVWVSNITRALLPDEFSLSQIRQVIEAVTGEQLDPPNFARDFPRNGLIEKTGGKIRAMGRPAAAYRFAPKVMWDPRRR